MVHKNCTVSLVFFVAVLCIYCKVDFVKASRVTTEKGLTHEAYSKLGFRKVMMSRRRRSIKEEGDSGQEDVCAGILGPKWNMNEKPKSPYCQTLDVWVPKKDGFTEFVKVNNQSNKVEGGFSIAIFCYALQLLPYNVHPIFKPFINDKGESNRTYDQMIEHIENKNCQAVAGDVTIRGNRALHVDFTIPYLNSEVYVLVQAAHEWNQTLLTFVKPFTRRLWITIIAACIFTGVALSILEYRAGNSKFSRPFYTQLIMVIWFPVSTFFFNEGKIQNKCSRVVLVMWLSMIFIVVQIFTATLSSWLTLDQLRPRMPPTCEHAGYQDEYKNALSSGRVTAIVDELPYIELFLNMYGSDYMKFGPINEEPGFGFAFPRGSHLLQDFSRAIINVTESDFMMKMKEKYLGFSPDDKSQPNQPPPQSLDVQSFIGLFIIMGTVILAAIISSEISLMRTNKKVTPILSTE